jgi:hypothetical protein
MRGRRDRELDIAISAATIAMRINTPIPLPDFADGGGAGRALRGRDNSPACR